MCCLTHCNTPKVSGTIEVFENIGDASFRTRICKNCAKILKLEEGDDLQHATFVEKTLKESWIKYLGLSK